MSADGQPSAPSGEKPRAFVGAPGDGRRRGRSFARAGRRPEGDTATSRKRSPWPVSIAARPRRERAAAVRRGPSGRDDRGAARAAPGSAHPDPAPGRLRRHARPPRVACCVPARTRRRFLPAALARSAGGAARERAPRRRRRPERSAGPPRLLSAWKAPHERVSARGTSLRTPAIASFPGARADRSRRADRGIGSRGGTARGISDDRPTGGSRSAAKPRPTADAVGGVWRPPVPRGGR